MTHPGVRHRPVGCDDEMMGGRLMGGAVYICGDGLNGFILCFVADGRSRTGWEGPMSPCHNYFAMAAPAQLPGLIGEVEGGSLGTEVKLR